MESTITALKRNLRKYSSSEKARFFPRFFKTGVGEYGYGDKFIGVTVPNARKIAIKYQDLPLEEIQKLLKSGFHEERLVALLILVTKYKKANPSQKKDIYDFYLKNTRYVNNWDLVDLSSEKIVGEYLTNNKDNNILKKLSKSENLWEKRIAIISTFAFIKKERFDKTLDISMALLKDDHDLIHKAVGWMLREVGKRDLKTEEYFLKQNYKKMPRTMLRYAIEKLPEDLRFLYLKGKI